MSNLNFIQTNWTSGELSPQIEGRVDIAKYQNGAATLNNVFVRVYGGAYRRPGTYLASATKLSTNAVRLIPFQFSTTQAYMIEAGHEYFRFYKDSGILNQITGNPVEISTSYTSTNLTALQYAQDADTMYITSNSYPPKKLTRSSHYLWSLEQVDFKGGPWIENNDTGAYMKASGSNGTITVTASGNAVFLATHSGSLLRVGTSNGYVRINTVSSNLLVVEATVQGTLNPGAVSYTTNWGYGAWSEAYGYPAAVSFFEQRLYFAGSTQEPQTVWGSAVLDYENFVPGTGDADSVSFTIADNQVNAIRWLAAGKSLAIGTVGGNFILDSDTTSGPVTPTNINIKKETTFGSALVLPKRIGNAVLYVQRNNLTVRELRYNFDEDAQLAADTNMLAEHITSSGIKDMDYQEAPDGILWCVRNDGKMATLTRLAIQDVMGWTRQETDGSFCAVAVIPNGNEDQVWVVAQRSVAAGAVKFVEYFTPFIQPSAQADSFYVDCGLSYLGTGTYAKTVSGLSHLNSRTVSILGDGAVYPDQMVTAGSITISKSCSTIHVGLAYTTTIKTCKLEAGSVSDSSQGLVKRVYKCIVRLWRSLGCNVGNETTQDAISFRDSSVAMDEVTPLWTGDKPVTFPHGWDKEGQVLITQAQPLPLNVLAVISQVEISTE